MRVRTRPGCASDGREHPPRRMPPLRNRCRCCLTHCSYAMRLAPIPNRSRFLPFWNQRKPMPNVPNAHCRGSRWIRLPLNQQPRHFCGRHSGVGFARQARLSAGVGSRSSPAGPATVPGEPRISPGSSRSPQDRHGSTCFRSDLPDRAHHHLPRQGTQKA